MVYVIHSIINTLRPAASFINEEKYTVHPKNYAHGSLCAMF